MKPEELAKIKREAEERAEFIESIYHLGRVSGDVAKAHKDQRRIIALCAEVERLQEYQKIIESIASERKRRVRNLNLQLNAMKEIAESWMQDYDELKEKYEPLEIVESETNDD